MELRERAMQKLAHIIADNPWKIIIGCLVLMILSGIAASFPEPIAIESNYKDLLPEDNPVSENYMNIIDNYSSSSTFYLLINGPDDSDLMKFADYIVPAIKSRFAMENEDPDVKFSQEIERIEINPQWEFINDYALLAADPSDVENLDALYSNTNLLPYLYNLNNNFEKTYTSNEPEKEINNNMDEMEADDYMEGIELLIRQLIDLIENPDISDEEFDRKADYMADLASIGEKYVFDTDREYMIISIIPKTFMEDYAVEAEFIQSLEDFIIQEKENQGYHDINARLTGMMGIAKDEMKYSEEDMSFPGLIALLLIIGLFITSFKFPRYSLFIVISLLVGSFWAVGIIGVTYHRLSMMTMMLFIILIGLGVDFGIHITTSFSEFLKAGRDKKQALAEAFRKTGIGVIIGGITTAIAFLCLLFTSSYAIREFGLAVGAGILSCLLAMFTLLPACFIVLTPKNPEKKNRLNIFKYKFLEKLASPVVKYRWIIVIVFVIGTVALAYIGSKNEFTKDSLSYENQEAPSITAYREMTEEFEMSADFYYIELSSKEECRKLVEELEKDRYMDSVAMIDSITYFIRTDEDQEKNLIYLANMRNNQSRQDSSRIMLENNEFYDFVQSDSQQQSIDDPSFDLENVENPDEEQDSLMKISLIPELERLRQNIKEFGDSAVSALGEDNKITNRRNQIINEYQGTSVVKEGEQIIRQLVDLINKDPDTSAALLNRLSTLFHEKLNQRVNHLIEPDTKIDEKLLADSRYNLLSLYVKNSDNQEENVQDDTQYLVTIYPKGYIWDSENFENISTQLTEASKALADEYLINIIADIENGTVSEESAQEIKMQVAYKYYEDTMDEDEIKAAVNDKSPAEFLKSINGIEFKMQDISEIVDPFALPGTSTSTESTFEGEEKYDKFLSLAELVSAINSSSDSIKQDLEKLDINVNQISGTPLIMMEIINIFGTEATRAAIYAFVAIFLLLIITFKSIKYGILTIIPLISGASIMMGLMYIFDIKYDFMNVTALPIILGIGIDDGVHIVNRYRAEKGDVKITLHHTGRAVIMTSLTTIFGFGTLGVMATMAGFRSFGAVLSIGIAACFLVSVTMLPALLVIIDRKKWAKSSVEASTSGQRKM